MHDESASLRRGVSLGKPHGKLISKRSSIYHRAHDALQDKAVFESKGQLDCARDLHLTRMF